MITVSNVSLNFSGKNLFTGVDIKFVPGNCYGIIGANGAGKSTFLKILSGEIEPSTGTVDIPKKIRVSVLEQDHYVYDEYSVLDTVIMGNLRLYEIMKQKDALYEKADFSEEDGILVSELEGEFTKLNGWEAETEASKLLQGLNLSLEILDSPMKTLGGSEKVKVLLAQALFGTPEVILLDEPTNHVDVESINWMEEFLIEYPGTVIVVSHDRHFLNNVCTHIVDIDFTKVKLYTGNYEFWYTASQMMQQMNKDQAKKSEDKIKELQKFIARFSANKSKSRQATSRKKLIEKLTVDDIPVSSRRYPFVGFQMDREAGKEILTVEGLSKTIDGEKVLDDVSFVVGRNDKIAFVGEHELANTTLFKILMEEIEPDEGTFKWGVSTSQSYFPLDNTNYFSNSNLDVINWLKQYSSDTTDTYLRGFLGRMLFSGDDVFKSVEVLSGGEKVRCMLSRMMMFGANVLVVDQPTNHLDLESITAVNNGLIDFKGVILLSSHDHQFIQTTANRIIELTGEGIVDRASTYDDFIEHGDLK